MKYCKICIIPDTRPDQFIDSNDVCSACRSFQSRKKIDWNKRLGELKKIVDEFKSNNLKWNCVIPSSGGKDSTYQAIRARELGLNPVLVTATTCDLSEIGKKNIQNLKSLGFDTVEISTNPIIRANLNNIGLREIGDISWPEHITIFTIPMRFALNYKIPLILWGENPQFEYGGPKKATRSNILDRAWLEEFAGLIGLRLTDLSETYKIKDIDLYPYRYPSEEELNQFKVTGLFLGYYEAWDNIRNGDVAKRNGFTSFTGSIEGGYLDFEKLDNYQHGIHDYFKYLKYGFGRTSDQLSILIRRNLISREKAIKIVKNYEGKFPKSYLKKPIEKILEKIGLSLEEFIKLCDKFTNKKIFKCNQAGELIKDDQGNIIKLMHENK